MRMPNWTSNLLKAISAPLPRSRSLSVLLGIFIGISISLSSSSLRQYLRRKREERENRYLETITQRPIEIRSDEILKGISGLVGEVVMIYDTKHSNTYVFEGTLR